MCIIEPLLRWNGRCALLHPPNSLFRRGPGTCPDLPGNRTGQTETAPATPRRVVPDWECRTAYIETFQIRMSPHLHERQSDWARREGRSVADLMIALLEDAVSRRAETRE